MLILFSWYVKIISTAVSIIIFATATRLAQALSHWFQLKCFNSLHHLLTTVEFYLWTQNTKLAMVSSLLAGNWNISAVILIGVNWIMMCFCGKFRNSFDNERLHRFQRKFTIWNDKSNFKQNQFRVSFMSWHLNKSVDLELSPLCI